MATNWTMTVDCARPAALAKLWSLALGYETAPTSVDPEGKLPSISFMRVPDATCSEYVT